MNRWSPVWLVPLTAFGIACWMVYQHYVGQGPLFEIHFENGEGIEPGKTRIRTKNVEVGEVLGDHPRLLELLAEDGEIGQELALNDTVQDVRVTPLTAFHGLPTSRIAVLRDVTDHLRDGRLVIPFDQDLPSESAYYLIYPKQGIQRPSALAFRQWVLDVLESERDGRIALHEHLPGRRPGRS